MAKQEEETMRGKEGGMLNRLGARGRDFRNGCDALGDRTASQIIVMTINRFPGD